MILGIEGALVMCRLSSTSRVGGAGGYSRVMRIAIVVLGVIVTLFGLLWALQGFGVLGGSPMSNTTTWSVIGPITALVGIGIALAGSRRKR